MGTKRKLTVIVICTAIICAGLLTAFFVSEHHQQQQELLRQQEEIRRQQISDALKYISDTYDKFIEAENDRPLRVALYNDLKAYKITLAGTDFDIDALNMRIDTILGEMIEAFVLTYNEMIDTVEKQVLKGIDDNKAYVSGIKSEIDDLHKSFNTMTDITETDGDAKEEKIGLYLELSAKKDAFEQDTTVSSNASELAGFIDKLSDITALAEEDAVLTGMQQMKDISGRIDELTGFITGQSQNDETGEILDKYEDALSRQETWFYNLYKYSVDLIAGTERKDEDDTETIERQISELHELKAQILTDGILASEDFSTAHFEKLDSEINDLITEYTEELDEIAERKAREAEEAEAEAEDPAGSVPNGGIDNGSLLSNITEFAEEVLRLTNIERANHGVGTLTGDNALLTAAALVRANEITVLWSHDRPDGRTCFTAYTEMGGKYNKLGENLGSGHRTPEDVVKGWMDSPGHRENMLDPSFTQLGVGVVKDSSGRLYWAQMFCG